MSNTALHDPRAATLALIDRLIRQGQTLQGAADIRIWQNDCAVAVNELSGASKAHWLSRAFSNALLVRSTDGAAVVEASAADIVGRMLEVLERARESIAGLDGAAPPPSNPPAPHRFDFVHDLQLRPVLEQAFVDSRLAFEAGEYEQALMTTCGLIEAIITDALKVRLKADATTETFAERIALAENEGLIRGGCARLPAAARAYRDAGPGAAISERDAKIARQVLHVVMRDLDPGR